MHPWGQPSTPSLLLIVARPLADLLGAHAVDVGRHASVQVVAEPSRSWSEARILYRSGSISRAQRGSSREQARERHTRRNHELAARLVVPEHGAPAGGEHRVAPHRRIADLRALVPAQHTEDPSRAKG